LETSSDTSSEINNIIESQPSGWFFVEKKFISHMEYLCRGQLLSNIPDPLFFVAKRSRERFAVGLYIFFKIL
jgi:hypothetical protein